MAGGPERSESNLRIPLLPRFRWQVGLAVFKLCEERLLRAEDMGDVMETMKARTKTSLPPSLPPSLFLPPSLPLSLSLNVCVCARVCTSLLSQC